MSIAFDSHQQKTLELIFDAILPRLEPESDTDSPDVFRNHAGLYPIADRLAERLGRRSVAAQEKVTSLLRVINLPGLCWFWTHRFRPFNWLDLNERVAVLAFWRDHRDPRLRTFFQMVRRITLFTGYASTRTSLENAIGATGSTAATNPTWEAIGYEGQTQLAAEPNDAGSIEIARVSNYAEEIECDYLIVGSGAGGSVMAAELAERPGLKILVVEKADFVSPGELGLGEANAMQRFYDGRGALDTEDLGVTIFSGSSVGGGTTINWMSCFDPPRDVMDQWSDGFGLSGVVSSSFQTSLLAVRQRLGLTTEHSQLNQQNQMLQNGCQYFGFATERIERNVSGCGDCGYCGFGCRAGAKLDARRTFLRDASRLGVRLLPGCDVKTIVRDGNVASHVVAGIRQADGDTLDLRIRFRKLILACGSVQTAALLLRSGFENPHIGNNLRLHPTTTVPAFYAQPIESWKGAPQTVVCHEFADLGGTFGVRIETAPCHPGFGAVALAWENPRAHKRLVQQMRYMANTIVVARDSGAGQVRIDSRGRPEIHYRLNEQDEHNILLGAARAIEIHRAAGARRVFGPHQRPFEFGNLHDDDEFSHDLYHMTRLGGESNRLGLFSTHQMGTARAAASPLRGAVDPHGRCFDALNVHICDASIFPTSTGVNPMVTIMTVSHLLAQRIREEGFGVYDF